MGRGEGRGKDGLLAAQQTPTHTFRLPSPTASKTLRPRISTLNTQAVLIGDKNTYRHLREEALATLKHFKNQHDEVY